MSSIIDLKGLQGLGGCVSYFSLLSDQIQDKNNFGSQFRGRQSITVVRVGRQEWLGSPTKTQSKEIPMLTFSFFFPYLIWDSCPWDGTAHIKDDFLSKLNISRNMLMHTPKGMPFDIS